jgi:hypothetical protein
MAWLKDHNPDINWERGSLKWRSDYCKTHCLKSKCRLEFITSQELLAEDPNNIFVCGIRLWTGEDGEDISLKLLLEYRSMLIYSVRRKSMCYRSIQSMIIALI